MDISLNKYNIFQPTLKKILLFLLLLFAINGGLIFCACINYTLDIGGYTSCPCGPFSFLSTLSVLFKDWGNPFSYLYLFIQSVILYLLMCLVIYAFIKIVRKIWFLCFTSFISSLIWATSLKSSSTLIIRDRYLVILKLRFSSK